MKKQKYFTEKREYGSISVYCECGGQVAVSARGYQNLPVGFGFAQRKSGYGFGIDCYRQKLYRGFCMKCGHSGEFKQKKISKRIYTKRIKKVDDAMRIQ